MAKIYYENDCNFGLLNGKKITVLGYGSQGHAHALNLKDSGADVTVGLRESSKSWKIAEQDGLTVKETGEAVKGADIVMILVPDELQAEMYKTSVAPNLKKGAYLAFGHGFNIHFGQIQVPEDVSVFMAAPKGPGHMVRRVYREGSGVPCLIAVHKDVNGDTKDIALAWCSGIGGSRTGILETTFDQETETDLFGEQAVLCGGVTELMKVGFEVLTEAGYDPMNAYFECVHEMKLIVDLVYEKGFKGMRDSISNTAEYGDYITGPKVITKETKEAMRQVLKDIQEGKFARDFILENQSGMPFMHAKRNREAQHPVEVVGEKLRSMMDFGKK